MSYSYEIIDFHGRVPDEPGLLVGYGALIRAFELNVPLPDKLSLISKKHSRISADLWEVFTPRHEPEDTLLGHLTFAFKYEGVDLLILKEVFIKAGSTEIQNIVVLEPTGQYTRRIWFFYEWLLDEQLNIQDIKVGNYVDAIDEKIQYPGASENSPRHRVRNNLPGVRNFCPLIRKTEILEQFVSSKLDEEIAKTLGPIRRDVLMRAAAFLMLKDSKATYAIEGESPPQNRMQRWGKAIGQAGQNKLSKQELLRLQRIVIEDSRFLKYGWREQDGFLGEHDREFRTPIPEHISARWQDVETLIDGLLSANDKLKKSDFDPVLAATAIAFGFVVIHPFVDGNGRIHRYLIHHVLTKMGFAKGNIVFPVSSAILEKINDYRIVLQRYSGPRLELINWEPSPDNNVVVLNETIDLYRYFDATKMAEFLYDCVYKTIYEIIPVEVDYLHHYDDFRSRIEQQFDMPETTFSLLVNFLSQGNGKLSKRAKENEFKQLTQAEIESIEELYKNIFQEN